MRVAVMRVAVNSSHQKTSLLKLGWLQKLGLKISLPEMINNQRKQNRQTRNT